MVHRSAIMFQSLHTRLLMARIAKSQMHLPRSLLQKDYSKHMWPLCSLGGLNFSVSSTMHKKTKIKKQEQRKALMVKNINKYEKKKQRRYAKVWSDMNVIELADALQVSPDDLFELILDMEIASYIEDDHQPIKDTKVFLEVAKNLDIHLNFVKDPKKVGIKEEKDLDIVVEPPKPEDMEPRPPVVAIMGHIDHGKTTLLDCLRKSRIVEGEFGGITQHIGAFSVNLDEKKQVTFIDTPGHAAFKNMRFRGASVTDIVVLIVDACEGVLDQTVESIRMIKEANTHMIVAINKIDRENANVQRTKKELIDAGVQLEDVGGEVQAVEISALKGTNVFKLVEAIRTLSELLQLSADYNGPFEGVIIESTVDKGYGKTATILVKRGKLTTGQYLVSKKCWARVRALLDDRGKDMKVVLPSQAAKVVGWRDLVPSAGDLVNQVPNEKRANEVVAWRKREQLRKQEEEALKVVEERRKLNLEEYKKRRAEKLRLGHFKPIYGKNDFQFRSKETEDYLGPPKLSFVIKADVDGSLEAILDCLQTYDGEEVVLDLMDFGVGFVTENDLFLAKQFNGFIYAFNVNVSPTVMKRAQEQGVEIKEFNIIYELINSLRKEMNERSPMKEVEHVLGEARVLQEFLINEGKKKVSVAGCKVTSGVIDRSKNVRLVRGSQTLFDGKLDSLRHLKDEVSSISQSKECGVRLSDDSVRFKDGDTLISYENKIEKTKIRWDPGF